MRRRAENVVAGLLGIMFVAFIIQIVFRYFFNFPVGWSSELSVITWLYMVLLGSAFWLKDSEEIRFDLVAGAVLVHFTGSAEKDEAKQDREAEPQVEPLRLQRGRL
jgi:TRAP-type mannitol/chloroaromatic compound transport system permease small subunit